MTKYIGIDIGASFVKGALFDLNSGTISKITKYISPTNQLLKNKFKNSRFEVDGDLYLKQVKRILHLLLKSKHGIAGIVLSSQMHGCIVVDSNKKPVTPFIGWQDERALDIGLHDESYLNVMHKILPEEFIHKTGVMLRPGLMSVSLFWLNEQGFFKKNKNKDVKSLFLGDFIALSLTKGDCVVESTHACGSGLFDVQKKDWHQGILNLLGLDQRILPTIVPTGTPIGFLSIQRSRIPIYVSVGDLQTAVLGSLVSASATSDLSINIGTGSQVSVVCDRFSIGNHDLRSFFDGKFLKTVAFLPAGRALNVIIHFVEQLLFQITTNKKSIDVWKYITNAISKKDNTNDLQCSISFFKNNATASSVGSILGITEGNFTIENIFFAALENMANNYFNAYQRIRRSTNMSDKIILSGGLPRKIGMLKTIISKKFNKRVELAPYEEETLTGLFILSLYCNKQFPSVLDAMKFVKKNGVRFV